jgi:predicted GTPase
MPYGDLAKERVQRFASMADLDAERCTAEEREEYEPHIAAGNVVYAGVDYAVILARAEEEADVLVWDGGNNDFPFLRPDVHVAVVDALRPEQITSHHPGEAVARMAQIIAVNKADAAAPEDVAQAIATARSVNPGATIVRTGSPVRLDDPSRVTGRRVLVVEDGPTITHGDMRWGAGYAAARAAGALQIVDPRASATPEIRAVYDRYPHIGAVLPAVGYDAAQLDGLRRTIEGADAEVVVSATPIDLAALIHLDKPVVRARYELAEMDDPGLGEAVDALLAAA